MRTLIKVIILVGILSILMVVAGSFVLSNNGLASPGNSMYPVQYRGEQLRLKLTLGSTQKLNYSMHLLGLRLNDLKKPSGDIQAKTIAVSRAIDQLAVNIPVTKTNDPRIKSLRDFYRSFDSAIQTCCLANPDESVLAIRRKWKTFGLMIDNSTKNQINWNVIAGSKLPEEELNTSRFIFTTPSTLLAETHGTYPLEGWHAFISCSGCHDESMVVKGTSCTGCHSQLMPSDHSSLECNTCHSPFGWKTTRIEHKKFSSSACVDCHGGDKPEVHSALNCDACHSYNAWLPVTFIHDQNETKECLSCHSVKPGHFEQVCSNCHTTDAWSPQNVNHENLIDCVSCHANKQTDDHYPGQCSTCHSTTSWSPQNINHASLTDCISCHNNDQPVNHYNIQCSNCHVSSNWVPAISNHDVLTDCQSCHSGPSNHLSGQCSTCHTFPSWNRSHPAFNINHESANGLCIACHTTGQASFTDCNTCHSQNEDEDDDD